MQTYCEKSPQLALDASIAVFVLMGTTPGDVEFLPLRRKMADENMVAELKARWPGRGLRPVGVIALCGTSPHFALKVPLEAEQVSALARAFLAYLHALLADGFAAQIEAEEVQELRCRWSLADTRMN